MATVSNSKCIYQPPNIGWGAMLAQPVQSDAVFEKSIFEERRLRHSSIMLIHIMAHICVLKALKRVCYRKVSTPL